jgi:hypothetical protein
MLQSRINEQLERIRRLSLSREGMRLSQKVQITHHWKQPPYRNTYYQDNTFHRELASVNQGIVCCFEVCRLISISIYGSTALVDLARLFSFLILYTVSRTPLTEDQLVARPLITHRTTQTHNKRTQTSLPRVGFESTMPVFVRANALDHCDRYS